MKKLIAVLVAMLMVTSLASIAWASDPGEATPQTDDEIVLIDEEPAVGEETGEEPALDGTEQGEESEADPVESEAPVAETPEPTEEETDTVEETEGASEVEETPLDGEPEEPEDPTETTDQIRATLPTSLLDDWSEAALVVAKSQLGYEPVLTKTASYNRYIYWSGEDYEFSPAFIYFCVYYAGIPSDKLQTYKTVTEWNEHALPLTEEVTLSLGDLVFLDLDEADNIPLLDERGETVFDEAGQPVLIPVADHIGIVSWTDGSLWAITATNAIVEIQVSESRTLAYLSLPVKPEPTIEETEPAIDGDAEEEEPVSYTLDNHVFCPEGYRLFLLPAGDLPESETYILNGTPLYYDPVDAMFFTFVLSDEELILTTAEDDRIVLEQNPDINDDGVLNIADANAIYQMVQHGGNYYTVDQVSLEARLRVDYHNIIDIDYIVGLINGVY